LLVVHFENVRPAALLEGNFRAPFGLIAEIARRRYIKTRPREPSNISLAPAITNKEMRNQPPNSASVAERSPGAIWYMTPTGVGVNYRSGCVMPSVCLRILETRGVAVIVHFVISSFFPDKRKPLSETILRW
jgi:hypothetical protein